MAWSFSFLLLAGMTVGEKYDPKNTFDVFDSYTRAYHAAQRAKRPMLVVLNPNRDSGGEPISLAQVRKTGHRRDLLEKYVVVVVDTDTDHGKIVRKLFEAEQLPRVVVIDREQKLQVFRTSRSLQGDDWTRILETFQTGDLSAALDLDAQVWCPT